MGAQSQLQPVWLVSDGRALASAMLAASRTDRRRGLIGVREITQPLVLSSCRWIHTFGMKCAIDVVYINAENIVIATGTMKPWRVGPYTKGSHLVIEGSTGSLDRWKIAVGSKIEVRNVEQ